MDVAARLSEDFNGRCGQDFEGQENIEDGYVQSRDGLTLDDELPAEISPEEAAQVQRLFWETSVLTFAQHGSTSAAACVQEQPQKDKRIVLLSFNRRPVELQQAILNSSLASSFLDKGIDIRPSWAGGAIVLVEGLGPEALDEDSVTWNVAVSEADEPHIFEALQMLPYIRPRLKPGTGRRLVPDDLELFLLSDDDGHSAQHSTDDENVDVQGLTEPPQFEVCIVRTFIHVRTKPASSTASLPNTI